MLALRRKRMTYYLQNMFSWIWTNSDLFVTVENTGTETDSECYQLMGTLCETISFLKDELRDKQVTVNNLISNGYTRKIQKI